MLKTFKYRLYPTKKQERILSQQLEELRWLWNTLLAERKAAWEERQETVDYYDQKAELPALKARERPGLKEVHSQVAQDVVLRLKRGFDAFFRRLKAGEEPGYPRFRGKNRYDSLTYPQWENGVKLSASEKRLIVSKIGDVKLVYHRPLEGTPKTATIRRMPTGKWVVTISCEWEPTPLPPTGQEIGIDVGLKTFATFSDGQEVANPRFFRHEEKMLAKAQRKHAKALDVHKAKREEVTERVKHEHSALDDQSLWRQVSQDAEEQATWKERQRRRKVVARTHERIRWRRENFTHQNSRKIVNQFDFIAVENLTVKNMVHNAKLAKSIHDAAWTQFAEVIRVKAEWAGRAYIAVNPAYTSQDCSGCGWRDSDQTLADRTFHCEECGLILDRDRNAALNILARGRACLPSG
jgi:putative transposase